MIGWSAPSGVSISSLGFGHQAGGQVIDSIIVMNYRAAVKAFYDGGGQLQLGAGASLAAGPFGRAADVAASASSTTHIAATYAYSASKGLYAGYSFEGSKISERPNTNRAYYGRPISAKDILTGCVAPPQDAAKLYTLLNNLGAGPRPGLPFAPQKTQNMPPHMAPPSSYNPPPQKKGEEGVDEPPPPYEQFDPSKGPPPQQQPNRAAASNSKNAPPSSANETINSSNQVNSTPARPSTHAALSVDTPSVSSGQYNPDMQELSLPESTSHLMTNDQPSTSNSISTTNNTYQGNMFDEAYQIEHPTMDSYGYPKDVKRPFNNDTTVVAKYDYTADRPTDLSFKAGDTIVVTKRLEDRQSWWEGKIGDKCGFFPANYTEDITEK